MTWLLGLLFTLPLLFELPVLVVECNAEKVLACFDLAAAMW